MATNKSIVIEITINSKGLIKTKIESKNILKHEIIGLIRMAENSLLNEIKEEPKETNH